MKSQLAHSIILSLILLPRNSHVAGFCIQSSPRVSTTKLDAESSRSNFVKSITVGTTTIFGLGSGFVTAIPRSNALVKGNAPPPPKGSSSDKPKCRNVEECQEMAERLAAKEEAEMKANATPVYVAPAGTRYKEIESLSDTNGRVAKVGDNVKLHYKVLKLGKRSFDGISGEGTVVFSRGYGLEDDEDTTGKSESYTFDMQIGDSDVIKALNDVLPGMAKGQIRKFSVLPQMGWEKATQYCDGGPGGSGAGGEIKTDYVLVPTATMVAQEDCMDKSKLPFPKTYAQQRRMAQRFDQSLIMEVELVEFAK